MLHQVPETQMIKVRSLLAIGWLLLIVSLFYDPISPILTHPDTDWSFLRLDPQWFDPQQCQEILTVQGECLSQRPYAIGARIFWGVIVGAIICLVFLFGHESWRRICPLSFFSQLPRLWGIQRQKAIPNPRTGAIRYELIKIDKNSWLARHHIAFQFGFLYVGLCLRILCLDSHRLLLGLFLTATILSSMIVGYLFAGKTWCQYFCPMGPVELFYTGPRGLWGSQAHQKTTQKVTQSMCRTTGPNGEEKTACVGCKAACFDIDGERSYWDSFDAAERKFFHYGYVGLVIGFYLYYFLYSGTLKYFFSGAWTHESQHMTTLFRPGFYFLNITLPIPKLLAVPLTLAVFTLASYWIICRLEKLYKAYCYEQYGSVSSQEVEHHIFSVATFITFNILFAFGTHSTLELLPELIEWGLKAMMPLLSGGWLYRTWGRSLDLYTKESLANSLRRQLTKLDIDCSQFLEGRSLDDLKPDEVYVLAKVLPGFSQESKLQVYQGILREALEQQLTRSQESLEFLDKVRLGLGIAEESHFEILSELGKKSPQLLYGDRSCLSGFVSYI